MQRRPLLAGNWKMNLDITEAKRLAEAVAESATKASEREVMIAPPFTSLPAIAQILADSNVHLAAQNICWAESGAFTGEISPLMLKELGCTMAIIGHSERRHVFMETDELINKRLGGALQHGITPILCIGETLDERENGQTLTVLERQIRQGLKNVSHADAEKIVVAYEPVWAIGTGKTASTEQAQEAHAFTRKVLSDIFEKNIAQKIRILYGGSVNPDNVDALMAQEDVDGALVGGAALKADSFDRIIHFRETS